MVFSDLMTVDLYIIWMIINFYMETVFYSMFFLFRVIMFNWELLCSQVHCKVFYVTIFNKGKVSVVRLLRSISHLVLTHQSWMNMQYFIEGFEYFLEFNLGFDIIEVIENLQCSRKQQKSSVMIKYQKGSWHLIEVLLNCLSPFLKHIVHLHICIFLIYILS